MVADGEEIGPMAQAIIAHKDDKIRHLTALLDKQMGTPCEQIRYEQATAELQGEIERLRNLITDYVNEKDNVVPDYTYRNHLFNRLRDVAKKVY